VPLTDSWAPGVYLQEVASGARPIQAVGTSTAAFVGTAPGAAAGAGGAVAINSWPQFVERFVPHGAAGTDLAYAVFGFFANGGSRCFVVDIPEGTPLGGSDGPLSLLEREDEVSIVAAPGRSDPATWDALLSHCEALTDRVAILDLPATVTDVERLTVAAVAQSQGARVPGEAAAGLSGGLRPRVSPGGYGAAYFPYITVQDPLGSELIDVPPSGHMAGVWARTDATRGVHKAPANEPIRGALNVTQRLTPGEQGLLNSAGINCIRYFPRSGIKVWGARTLDDAASEWRYLNVRRLFAMIEESIVESTDWIVFEINDRTLWSSIRRDLGAFLTRVWRDGALMGRTPEEAFFVQCDHTTNTPDVIAAGQVVTVIGLAPVKPAEFVIFQIKQQSGRAEVREGV
jgi:phage tail sheath protein FI